MRRLFWRALPPRTKIVQGWPKLWANFRALIGISSQSVGPSLAIWANSVQFSFEGRLNDRVVHCQAALFEAVELVIRGSACAQWAAAARRAGTAAPTAPPPWDAGGSPTTETETSGARRGGGRCGGDFPMQVYGRPRCPLGHVVRRDRKGPHKRQLFWVPEVQTRAAPRATDG